MPDESVNVRDRRVLELQRWVTYICLPFFLFFFIVLFRWIGGYRCADLKALRRRVAELLAPIQGKPLLICPNHLTLIDSMLLAWFLFSWRRYFSGPRFFPWHTPEIRNFAKNIPLQVMCYLGRCLFVKRGGGRSETRRSLDHIAYLLWRGAVVFIFPEGTRSRTGRIEEDQVTYSVGQLCLDVPECKVLCVYMRGASQETYSALPKRSETFYVDVRLFEPPMAQAGLRGSREIALQIHGQLRDMERGYFCRQSGA